MSRLSDKDRRNIVDMFAYKQYLKLDCCDWTGYNREIAKPKEIVKDGKKR